MTEEFVSLKGEIGARRCHCCRGRMAKGTSSAARKPTSPPGAGSTTRAPWRHSPGPGGVSRRNTLAAENVELRRRLTRSETELEKARRAPGAAPATIYRRRRPPGPPAEQPRGMPRRALSSSEREVVLAELRSERFVDSSLAAVWATLLGRGPLPLFRAHRVPAPVGLRRGAGAPRPAAVPGYERPELPASRANEVWSWDITKLEGPATWTDHYLYAILDVFCRYAVGWTVRPPRIRRDCDIPHRPDRRTAEDRPGDPDRARRPRQLHDLQTGGLPGRRPRRDPGT